MNHKPHSGHKIIILFNSPECSVRSVRLSQGSACLRAGGKLRHKNWCFAHSFLSELVNKLLRVIKPRSKRQLSPFPSKCRERRKRHCVLNCFVNDTTAKPFLIDKASRIKERASLKTPPAPQPLRGAQGS